MALIHCPECDREISDAAHSCPYCGYPLDHVAPEADPTSPVEETPAATQPKPSKKKFIILVCVLAIVAVIVVALVIHQQQEAARNAYIKNLWDISTEMALGAIKSETACIFIHDVWYNTIYQKNDLETNKYTIHSSQYDESKRYYPDSAFNSDFNTSLRTLFESEEHIERIDYIERQTTTVNALYKELQAPPDDLISCYNAMESLYDAYLDLTACATDPTGSLSSYTATFNAADSSFSSAFQKLTALIPDSADPS